MFGNRGNRAVNYRYNSELQHESSDKLEFIWIPTSRGASDVKCTRIDRSLIPVFIKFFRRNSRDNLSPQIR